MTEKCADNCPLIPRVEALERELERLEGIQGEQYKAILEKLDGLTQKHDALNAKLSELEAKPGKRWEALAEKALWAVCAAVIAFLLAKIGL